MKKNNRKNIFEMIEYPKEGIISKVIMKNNKIDIGLYCMVTGTEMSEHTSTKSGFVYVVEGKGIFNLEGKNIEMLPGVFFFMRKNAIHSLKAKENTTFVLGLM